MYEKILKAELKCPSYLPADVKSFIEHMLIRDPLRRLGAGPGNIKELEAHPFFQAIDFKKVYEKAYTPVYKPDLGGETDVANFDPQFTGEQACDSVVDPNTLAGAKGNHFEGFTYHDTSAMTQQKK